MTFEEKLNQLLDEYVEAVEIARRCNDELDGCIDLPMEAKQSIIQAIEEVIGEYEPEKDMNGNRTLNGAINRNRLRKRQRKTLKGENNG